MASAFASFVGKIKEQIDKASSLVSGQGKAVKSLLIFIVTTLLNQLATNNFFKCPAEDKHKRAGWSFMFIPGVMLAIIILMSSERVSEGSILFGRRKKATARFFCRTISLSLAYSVLALLSWVVASLLFTETFACTKLGPAPNTKNQTKIEIYNSKKAVQNAESKVIGLYILLIALLVQVVLFFIHKCSLSDLSEVPHRLKSMDSYDKLEAETAKAQFELLVEEHSKANALREIADLTKTSGSENENEPDKKDFFSRDKIEELRNKLIQMYPRLDNMLDRRLPYRKVEGKRGSLRDGEEEALL